MLVDSGYWGRSMTSAASAGKSKGLGESRRPWNDLEASSLTSVVDTGCWPGCPLGPLHEVADMGKLGLPASMNLGPEKPPVGGH